MLSQLKAKDLQAKLEELEGSIRRNEQRLASLSTLHVAEQREVIAQLEQTFSRRDWIEYKKLLDILGAGHGDRQARALLSPIERDRVQVKGLVSEIEKAREEEARIIKSLSKEVKKALHRLKRSDKYA